MKQGDATVYAADIVLGGWPTGSSKESSPPEFKIIRAALVLRQDAFWAVNLHCLQFETDTQPSDKLWSACK